jgi:hypothetical protein
MMKRIAQGTVASGAGRDASVMEVHPRTIEIHARAADIRASAKEVHAPTDEVRAQAVDVHAWAADGHAPTDEVRPSVVDVHVPTERLQALAEAQAAADSPELSPSASSTRRPRHARGDRLSVVRMGLLVFVLAPAMLVGCTSGNGHRETPISPKVRRAILITLDTTRADHTGPYGYTRAATPSLDVFARRSLQFNHAYTVIPTTGPAHISILTGLYPQEHGSFENGMPARPGLRNLAELMRRDGRRTAAIVSARHVGSAAIGLAGFETWDAPPTTRDGGETVTLAIEWVRAHKDEPFFLWVHLFDPHWPYVAHEGISPGLRGLLAPLEGVPTRPKGGFLDSPMSADETARLGLLYDAEIEYTDRQVGRFLEFLDTSGVADSSLLVITADHGEILGEAPEALQYKFDHGKFLLPGELHVPLWIRAPGLEAGAIDDTVETRALYGSMLWAAGIETAGAIPRLPRLGGVAAPAGGNEQGFAFVARRSFAREPAPAVMKSERHAVVTPKYVAIRIDGPTGRQIELYDRDGSSLPADMDPRSRREVEAQCDQAIDLWLRALGTKTGPAGGQEMDEEMKKFLQSLGYVR